MVTDLDGNVLTLPTHLVEVKPPSDPPPRPFGLFEDTPPLMLAGLTIATAGASLLSVIGLLPRG